MIHKACMPVYIVIQIFSAGGHSTRGSIRGPRGPKKLLLFSSLQKSHAPYPTAVVAISFGDSENPDCYPHVS